MEDYYYSNLEPVDPLSGGKSFKPSKVKHIKVPGDSVVVELYPSVITQDHTLVVSINLKQQFVVKISDLLLTQGASPEQVAAEVLDEYFHITQTQVIQKVAQALKGI